MGLYVYNCVCLHVCVRLCARTRVCVRRARVCNVCNVYQFVNRQSQQKPFTLTFCPGTAPHAEFQAADDNEACDTEHSEALTYQRLGAK